MAACCPISSTTTIPKPVEPWLSVAILVLQHPLGSSIPPMMRWPSEALLPAFNMAEPEQDWREVGAT